MVKYHIPGLMAAVILLNGCVVFKDDRLVDRGYHQIVAGDLAAAEKNLLEAVKANPENALAHLNLGVVYQNTGRFEKAKEEYRKVISLDSGYQPRDLSQRSMKGKTVKELAEHNLKLLE